MKNLFSKTLILALLLLTGLFSASAATVETHTCNAASTSVATNLYSRGITVYSITFANTSTTATNYFQFVDSQDSALTRTLTNISTLSYRTNLTTIITTPAGVSQTNVYTNVVFSVPFGSSNVVTYSKSKLFAGSVVPGATTTWTFNPGLEFPSGVTLTNTVWTNTVTITFDPNY